MWFIIFIFGLSFAFLEAKHSTPEEINKRRAESNYMSKSSLYEFSKKNNLSGTELLKRDMEDARIKYEAAANAEAIAKALKKK